jgi:hypothetical protein
MLKWHRTNPAPFSTYEATGVAKSTRFDLDGHKLEEYTKTTDFAIERRGPVWRAFAAFQCLGEFPTLRKAKAICENRHNPTPGSMLAVVCS